MLVKSHFVFEGEFDDFSAFPSVSVFKYSGKQVAPFAGAHRHLQWVENSQLSRTSYAVAAPAHPASLKI